MNESTGGYIYLSILIVSSDERYHILLEQHTDN